MKSGLLNMHLQDVVFQMVDAKSLFLEATISPRYGARSISDSAVIEKCVISGEFSEHDQNAIPGLQALAGEILWEYSEYRITNSSIRRCGWCGSTAFGTQIVGGGMMFPPHICPDGCVSHKIALEKQKMERVATAVGFMVSGAMEDYTRFRDREPGSRGC